MTPSKILLILLFLLPFSSYPQWSGAVKTLVKDKETNLPIDSAIIEVSGNDSLLARGITLADGECLISNLIPGHFNVTARKMGYQSLRMNNVVAGEGKTAYVTLVLTPPSEGKKLKKKKNKGVRLKMK